MRDYRKLTVFQQAEGLVIDLYRWTATLPAAERYVLQSQIRRAAVSIPSNIVEGSARLTEGEYVNFLNIALGSAAELAYLLDLTGRLYPSVASDGTKCPSVPIKSPGNWSD